MTDQTNQLTAEIAALTRWKDEALPVIDGLQELGRALDLPLGVRITGPAALEAVRKLIERAENAEALAESVSTEADAAHRIANELRTALALALMFLGGAADAAGGDGVARTREAFSDFGIDLGDLLSSETFTELAATFRDRGNQT